MHYSHSQMALLTAICMLGIACTDAPTDSPAELAAPQFAKGGKPGPGTPDDAFPTIVRFRDALTDNIRSDAELRVGDGLYKGPDYEDGVCGVTADLGNFDDARMNPDANYRKGKHRKTCGDARVLIIEGDDPVDGGSKFSIAFGVFSNIDKVLTVTGTDERRWGVFNAPAPCGQLFFSHKDIPKGGGSDSLLVSFDDNGTRAIPADDVWIVKTQPYPDDVGFCSEGDRLFHMPFQMTIRRQ